jgi:hypothetical protein
MLAEEEAAKQKEAERADRETEGAASGGDHTQTPADRSSRPTPEKR